MDWLAISPPGHIYHRRLPKYFSISRRSKWFKENPWKRRNLCWNEKSTGGAGQGYTFSLECHSQNFPSLRLWGCLQSLTGGQRPQCSLVSGAHMANQGKYQGGFYLPSRCSRWMWNIHLIYEDPLGCAIASSWNWSENNFLYVFLGNDIIWISRYLDGKTCLSASGAGAAGVSAALSLDPYKIIMNILAQKAKG